MATDHRQCLIIHSLVRPAVSFGGGLTKRHSTDGSSCKLVARRDEDEEL